MYRCLETAVGIYLPCTAATKILYHLLETANGMQLPCTGPCVPDLKLWLALTFNVQSQINTSADARLLAPNAATIDCMANGSGAS